ncbi:MAG: 4-hydroxy-tetrahydrodipicolinate reductase [Kofleriaceae bacterium]
MKVLVVGAAGKMGRAVQAAASERELTISATVDQGDDLAALATCDVYVDFSTPAATLAVARAARATKTAAVIGTTGLGDDAEAALAELARVAPIVVAANFSLGVNLMLGLVRQAARALGPAWDAEVVETHHKLKRDAPSGTALAIAKAIAAGHGSNYDEVKRHTRDGDVGPRPRGEIGVATVRGGDVVGEHTAYFFGTDERIEISHRATSRGIFASGALVAAAWVVGKPPGRYTMLDVLGLPS